MSQNLNVSKLNGFTTTGKCKLSEQNPMESALGIIRTACLNLLSYPPLEREPLYHAFSKWRLSERIKDTVDYMNGYLKGVKPSIVLLQGVKEYTNKFGDLVSSMDIVKCLKDNGYDTQVTPYNLTGSPFAAKFVTAVNPDEFDVVSSKLVFISKTPNKPTDRENNRSIEEIKEHNYGYAFERSFYVTKLKFKDLEQADLNPIYAINVHMPLPTPIKEKASEILADFVKSVLKKEPEALFVVGGNFNSFIEEEGKTTKVLTEGKNPLLKDVTEDLVLPNNEPMKKPNTTYTYPPFDLGKHASKFWKIWEKTKDQNPETLRNKMSEFAFEHPVKGAQLTHIYVRGLEALETFKVNYNPRSGLELKGYSEEEIKAFVKDHFKNGYALRTPHCLVDGKLSLARE